MMQASREWPMGFCWLHASDRGKKKRIDGFTQNLFNNLQQPPVMTMA